MGARLEREPFQLLTKEGFNVDGKVDGSQFGIRSALEFFLIRAPAVSGNRFHKG